MGQSVPIVPVPVMKKFSFWFIIPILVSLLAIVATEASAIHNSGLFITSATMLALVVWISFISSCVAVVGRIMA